MLRRTHLAIGIGIALYFLPHVTNKLLFIPIVLIASLLPDVDSITSSAGSWRFFRPIQMMVNHRGFFHSYTFCIIVTILLTFLYPISALPFFLGYSFHLLADSFTVQGIKPFPPFKAESKGPIRTGSKVEQGILLTFIMIDVVLFIRIFV
ncbi:MAG: metal-dependent hydrolase [Nanoarchaeota archaeon]|nr:metal-dependent hydrolase [Nanoarchaeota archaeon]